MESEQQVPVVEEVKIEVSMYKTSETVDSLISSLENIVKDVRIHLNSLKIVKKDIIVLEKSIAKAKNSKKRSVRNTDPNKKIGFAKAGKVSKAITDFMDLPEGTDVSRADVIKKFSTLVNDNGLKNKEKPKFINLVGDAGERIKTLLDKSAFNEDGSLKEITFTNIHRYITHNFISSKKTKTEATKTDESEVTKTETSKTESTKTDAPKIETVKATKPEEVEEMSSVDKSVPLKKVKKIIKKEQVPVA